METVKKFFPFSFAEKKDVTALVINILIYLAVGVVAGVLIKLLSWIPILGVIISLLGAVVDLYVLAGIVFSVLDYLDLLKK